MKRNACCAHFAFDTCGTQIGPQRAMSPNTSSTRRNTHQGFTLIELMVTLTVLAILASLAAPSFRETLLRNRTAAISNEFTASLAKARSEAINRNTCVTICRSTSGTQCDAGTNWTTGWVAFVNAACDATVDAPAADDLILSSGALNSEFSMTSTATNNDKLVFAAVGHLRSGDTGRFDLQFSTTGASRSTNRSICVSRLGRTLLTSYGATCP